MIVATFGPEGPQKCSGLDVLRYDADSYTMSLGRASVWLRARKKYIKPPFGTTQQFLYCYCVLEPGIATE